MEEMWYEYWFANLKPLTDKKKRHLKTACGKISKLFYIEEKKLKMFSCLEEKDIRLILDSRTVWKLQEEYERLRGKGVELVPYLSPQYPVNLTQISSPPYALYVKGQLPDENRPSVAIVGARGCSPYGEHQTEAFTEILVAHDIQIISGMARGIDGIAQRKAIETGGRTFGILASGADVCYPREHIELYMNLQKQGGIITEQPPETAPLPQYFPARNRIISGLADAVLVMEAKKKSGSLITADFALEQGKDVYALPGMITNVLSQGCNELIAQGAGILLSPEELVKELEVAWANRNFKESNLCAKNVEKLLKKEIMLESTEKLLYSCLGQEQKNLNQLIHELGLPAQVLMEQMISLEMKGLVQEITKNYYVRI